MLCVLSGGDQHGHRAEHGSTLRFGASLHPDQGAAGIQGAAVPVRVRRSLGRQHPRRQQYSGEQNLPHDRGTANWMSEQREKYALSLKKSVRLCV